MLKYNDNGNSIEIFLPCGDGHFRFELRRIAIPFTDGGIRQNQDLWRLYELYLFDKDLKQMHGFPVCNKGEWECAIRIKGTPDFHGGYHGYEHLADFSFTPFDDRIEFWQDSVIILQGTEREIIADHKKKYVFRNNTLTLTQSVLWHKSVDIDRAFMTMLPIRRKDGDYQITDTAVYDGVEYDVSEEGHSSLRECDGVKCVSIHGKRSGVYATVSVDFENSFSIQNTPAYNKFYFKYAWNRPTAVGERWNTTAVYSFDYKKGETK